MLTETKSSQPDFLQEFEKGVTALSGAEEWASMHYAHFMRRIFLERLSVQVAAA
jgi:hypothetical protein